MHDDSAATRLGPDLVLVNGTVLTVDANDRVADAVAVIGGRIAAVGGNAEVAALQTGRTTVIDLAGRTLIPGLTDAHVHLADSGTSISNAIDVRDSVGEVRSVADLLEQVRLAARRAEPGRWLLAAGSPLQDLRLSERRLPRRDELDAAAPANPLMVTFGAHVTVVNSAALVRAGATAESTFPGAGRIEVDPTTGELTGKLLEGAQSVVRRAAAADVPMGHNPNIGIDHVKRGIRAVAERTLARGVTSVHEIVTTPVAVRAYQELARDGDLPLRVSLLVRVVHSHMGPDSLLGLGFTTGFGDDRLRLGGVKLSIDGGATGKLAAFYEPYHGDHACECGLLRLSVDEVEDIVDRYHRAGHRVCIHAMGDRAMDMALDAIERAVERNPRRDHRHRIEHLGNWLVTPERLERVRRSGILPVPNLSFMYYLYESFANLLGAERLAGAFPLKTLIDAGVPVTTGSDGPSSWPFDALRDMGTAVSRRSRDGSLVGADEALSPAQALRMCTMSAAYNGFDERRKGSIEVGKLADFAILAQNPLATAPSEIGSIAVDATLVEGRVVYQRRGAEVLA